MDFVKDACEACILCFLVANEGCATIADLRSRLATGELAHKDIFEQLSVKLEYAYVSSLQEKEERDIVYENVLLFIRHALEVRSFYKAMRRGDVGAMELIFQLWGPQFVGSRQSNYGDALTDIRVGMCCEWEDVLKRIVKSNWVINPWGKSGKFLGLDEFIEELV